jgi:polysaccharide chain length determinant protein (PEP-CTERM system associated)
MNGIYDELRAALHAVWHRRWLALALAWGVCLLGWLAVAMVPNKYESHARIFVQLDDPLADQLDIGRGDRQRDIERVRQTLTSAVNMEKVVRSTRIAESVHTPKQMEAVVLELAGLIKVESKQDNLFEITAASNDGAWSDAENAKMAQEIVQKMIDIFREENLRGSRGAMTGSLEFINQQLAARQKQLEDAEAQRVAFESRNPALAGGAQSVSQRLDSARNQLRDVDADLAGAQGALAAINGQLAGTPQTIAGAPGQVGGARAALAQAQGELNAMRARGLTDSHPDVIAMRNQVAALRTAAAGEGSGASAGTPNPAYTSLLSIKAERQANVQALQARRAALQADMGAFGAQAAGGPEANAEAQRINRDYDVLKKQYDDLLADREQLQLRGQVESEHSAVRFEVIDPPTTPRAPIAPNRPLLLAMVLVMGLCAGGGAAFLFGQLRSTFASAGKLERATGLPVLGSISTTITDAGRALRSKRLKQFGAASVALLGIFVLLVAAEFVQRGMVA